MVPNNRLQVEDVSVIVVNYNGQEVLAHAIASVLDLHPRPRECIVVDNGSTDRSVEIVREFRDPAVRLIPLAENRGVAGGRNAGVRAAGGQVYAFLDSDGEATPSWLPNALACLSKRPEAGAVAPLVLMERGQTINGAGSFLDSFGHGRDRLWGEALCEHEEAIRGWRGHPVDYPMGCGMIIRRRGLERLWPLDESLPKWHDDTEIGIRVRRLGYDVLFEPCSRVLHHPGHSDPRDARLRQQLAETARLFLVWKYYSVTHAMWATLHYSFFALTGSRRDPFYRQALYQSWSLLWHNRRHIVSLRRLWRVPTRKAQQALRNAEL